MKEQKSIQAGERTYTPGPWIITDDDEHSGCAMVVDSPTESHNLASGFPRGRFEAMANARLIAAAPELLEALILASEAMKHAFIPEGCPTTDHALYIKAERAAQAAIKKAKGAKAS